MQRKIVIILILMSCCVICITGLQLYWNYKNYLITTHNFKNDSTNALNVAVDKEIAFRHQKLISKVKDWLADTSFLSIECNYNNRDSSTVFTVQDVHPRFQEDSSRKAKFFNIGINHFTQKLKKITPEAKKIFINHFADRTFKNDLEDGAVFYYTQGLGDSISKAYDESKFNPTKFIAIYKSELAKRHIMTTFKLVQKPEVKSSNLILSANTAFRKPYENEPIYISISNINSYYLREMKGLLLISLLLIGATIFCFYYTVKTLLSQQKLVVIKNQFISNMTHEINTPLASIQVTAEALKQFNQHEQMRDDYIDIILFQTKKLNNLSNEILANARLETIGFKTDEEINLNFLIETLIKDLPFKKQISYINLGSTGSNIIKGNAMHLSRAISNILENAFKYNDTENPAIEIELSKNNQEIRLSISDNGPGIAPAFKDKVFDQFFRVPTGNVHDIKGHGLGLSYVKKVILQHNGSINLMDNHPKGSIFSIILPH
jgi:two-component system phosphate regulon sensor histidine kinase PhoR